MGNHALVFGASGINGWAVVNAILNDYPSKDVFTKVTAMVNRPLARETAIWPDDPRLQIVAGVNLMKGTQEELETEIKEKINDVENVTQVYCCAYKQSDDPDEECKVNEAILERAVTAIDHLSTKLSSVVLPTGTKAYSVHMIGCLERLSQGKSWTWSEVRPDIIVGFVPNNNTYCVAQTLGIYLSVYRAVEGEGAKCPFPGTDKSWLCRHNESPQDMIAHLSIHASLHPEKTASKAFNVGGEETTWSTKWPVICEYFGLKGTGPEKGSTDPSAYIKEHGKEWAELEEKHNLRKGVVGNDISHPFFQYFVTNLMDFDRYMSKEAAQGIGYTEEIRTPETWKIAFDRIIMREAKIIP